MSKRLLPFLLLLIVAALVGAFWFGVGDSPTPSLAEASIPEPGVPPPDAAGELDAAPTDLGSDPEARGTSPQREVARAVPDAAELDDPLWVEVSLTAPAGSPSDPTLTAVSVWSTADPEAFEEVLETATVGGALVTWIGEREDAGSARRPFDAERSVRVPFPRDAERGWVLLDGRYLFLAEPQAVALAAGERTAALTPELGAWVTGNCRLPTGAAKRGLTADAPDGSVELRPATFPSRSSPRRYRGDVELEAGADFEFRGVPTKPPYLVRADLEGLAEYLDMGFRVEPGQRHELALPMTLGGRVTGRVVDGSGAGIEGAEVQASGGRSFFGREAERTDQSDAQGHFDLRGLRVGGQTIEVDADGWVPRELDELEMADAETIEDVRVVLERGNRIAGRVLWPDGRPAAGATVTASTEQGQRGWTWKNEAGQIEADADGAFEIPGLEAGPFSVLASAIPEPPAGAPETPETAESDDEPAWTARASAVEANTLDLELRLREPQGVAGVVRDDTGEAVTDFRIEAELGTNSTPWNNTDGVSDSFESGDGSFLLQGLYPGAWTLTVDSEGYSQSEDPVRVTIPHDGPPIEISVWRSASVSGLVLDPAGTPVADARVVASTGGGSAFGAVRFGASNGDREETDADGRFRFEHLAKGGVELTASTPGWADSAAVALDLEPALPVEGVVLTLRVGGRITGEVYDETGAPRAGQRVTYGADGMTFAFGMGSDAVTTDAAGRFSFEHVTPGDWIVSAGPPEEELLERMRNADDQSAFIDMMSSFLTAPVEIVDGGEVHVVLGAEPKQPVRVFGQVTEAGEPLAEVQVMAIAEGGAFMQGLKMASTESDGTYELVVDRPGAYVLGVQGTELDRTLDFPVDVPDAEEIRFDLAMPLGRIEGAVYGPDGGPLEGITVGLSEQGGGAGLFDIGGAGSARTGEDGRFEFGHLDPGAYTVRAGASGAFGLFGAVGSGYGTAIESEIDVDEDETVRGIDLTLTRAGALEGRVRDADGNPVAEATIFVRDEAGRLLSRVSAAVTDAAGRYRYDAVTPGRVSVSARAEASAAGDSDLVQVVEGETTEADLTLALATMLVITVVDGENEPLRANLQVLDEQGFEVGGMVSTQRFQTLMSEGISTKEQRIGPLPPGKYRVIATTGDGRDGKKPVTLKGQEERNVKVRVKD